ncbi:MAG TPA: sulfite exporter TauE/SafE family protein [Acidimicrobiia bacterium]|nr:sulfite exporter TauE/SafE family protein [Acidimicrobiia bacterium]
MDLQLVVGVLLIGVGVGFLSGTFGKGGAAVSTPLLHALGVPAMVAIASPLPATIPATLLASRGYSRAGHVDREVLRVGLVVGVPLTAIGALLTRWVGGESLVLATDVILLALGLRVLSGAHSSADTDPTPARVSRPRTVAVVAGAGLISGLLGNSGGFLLAPLFVNVLRMPIRRALGTSLALATALAVPGTIVHAWLGHIDWTLALVFGLGAVPFATFGATMAMRIRERSLSVAYGIGIATLSAGLLVFAR